ncbi:hypothetical protein J6590_064384 [Homalodisca vitripennis]|nr:hypothetical protein J6590_064384 [Homalodisca vitripennis]
MPFGELLPPRYNLRKMLEVVLTAGQLEAGFRHWTRVATWCQSSRLRVRARESATLTSVLAMSEAAMPDVEMGGEAHRTEEFGTAAPKVTTAGEPKTQTPRAKCRVASDIHRKVWPTPNPHTPFRLVKTGLRCLEASPIKIKKTKFADDHEKVPPRGIVADVTYNLNWELDTCEE